MKPNNRLVKVAAAIDEKKRSTPEGAQLEHYVHSITNNTQAQTVLRHLYERHSITSMEAFREYNITRLAVSIFELRRAGVKIVTIPQYTADGKRYGEYRLEGDYVQM